MKTNDDPTLPLLSERFVSTTLCGAVAFLLSLLNWIPWIGPLFGFGVAFVMGLIVGYLTFFRGERVVIFLCTLAGFVLTLNWESRFYSVVASVTQITIFCFAYYKALASVKASEKAEGGGPKDL